MERMKIDFKSIETMLVLPGTKASLEVHMRTQVRNPRCASFVSSLCTFLKKIYRSLRAVNLVLQLMRPEGVGITVAHCF